MSIRAQKEITRSSRFFLEPRGPLHRQYEALRAYHVEELPSAEAARRFGYSPGAFRVLCHRFRHDPERVFFASPSKGPQAAPKKDHARERVIELRKQNLSIMDALSSAVAMKVSCDLQLTLMASSLYRLLGAQIGRGYETARARHIFRDFVDATAKVTIDEDEIRVRFQKRAHNPLLLAAGLAKTDVVVPWLGGKRLRLVLG